MHALMRLPRWARWCAALLAALLYLAAAGSMLALPMREPRWLPVLLVAPFVLAPLESLLLTPLYGLTGRFTYYSPMLLVTRHGRGALELHLGTLLDYVTHLRWSTRGPHAARVVLTELLQGLLSITSDVERGAIPPHTEIRATSYVFSDRSLARLGFAIRPAPPHAGLNLTVAVVGIAVRLAYVRGHLALPAVGRVRQGVVTAGELARRAPEIRASLARIRSSGGGTQVS